MSNNMRTRRVAPMRTKDDLNKRLLWATSDVTKEQVVRMTGLQFEEAYHSAVPAIADGTQTDMPLLMAWHSVETGGGPSDEFIASEHYLYTSLDTSSAAVGDLVYLSATTAGALTLTATLEPVGWVQDVGNPGKVWFDPVGAKLGAVSANSQKSRPDWDADWEARIFGTDGGDGDGSVYVNNSTGNDAYGDGTPDNPYATLDAAILDIPHNRNAQGLRNTTIRLANTGTHYDLSTEIVQTDQLTLLCALPDSASYSTTVGTVVSTNTIDQAEFNTALVYAGDDAYKGHLLSYTSGKLGWVSSSYNAGGVDRLFATQNTNGTSYDTITTSDALDIYAPADLVEIRSRNTGGNGTNFAQMDNFKIRYANLTSSGSAGKLVFYQSRVTLQDCYIGSTIGRLFVNNGSLTISNCFIACDGESQEFGQIGGSAGATIQLRGGTCFDGEAGFVTPVSATGGTRVLFSGPVMFKGVDAISLANGAEVGYADAYDADVNTYWWDMDGTEPHYRVDLRDTGSPVTGVIPDIHGVVRDVGTIIVSAKAPCQLLVGRGSSISVTGKTGGYSFTLTDGADYTSYNAYDDSFIRMDRARANTTQGLTWGPHKTTVTGGTQGLTIDWSMGSSQVYDLSAVTASSTITWNFPDNGELGAVATLELVQGTTLTHTWSSSFEWAGGTPPVLSTTSGQRDFIRFFYTGTEWVGAAFALNVS